MTETLSPPQQAPLRWYQGIPRYAWLVLAVAALGWMCDTMDQNLFNLVAQRSIRDLLQGVVPAAGLQDAVNAWRGNITCVFLIGWAIGGFIFGILGDKLGRTRTLMLTILTYSIFTGLGSLSQTVQQYAAFRFLTALGVGGEFAAGVALVAEVFPDRARPMALGSLQALSAIGNMTAALIVLVIKDSAWRSVYLVGALPALLIFWIMRSVQEPERWRQAKEAAVEDAARKELGSIAQMLGDPVLRRNTIAGVLLAVAGVGGLWGVGFWLKDLMDIAMREVPAAQRSDYGSMAFLAQQVGAFFGMFAYAALSERVGRRPSLLLFFILAFGAVQGTFWFVGSFLTAMLWAPILGFCALAPFSAYCVYFPELYPTRLRATGVGFCYNCARIFAAAAPFVLGRLSAHFAAAHGQTVGFRMAASVVACIYVCGLVGLALAPETRGRPLPE